jgi:hypothetical protein
MLKQIERTLRSHPFVTPKFLQNAHIQTLFPRLMPYFKTQLPKAERRHIKLPDGSQLAANCWWQKDKEKYTTVVIIGGIEGYRNMRISRSVISTCNKAYYLGYNVIHLKQRAEGDTVSLTKSIGYSPYDLPIVFDQLKAWNLKKVFVIGFSAGGYNLLFALGELGKKAKEYVLGAIAISAPTNVLETWQHVEKNAFYDRVLLDFYKHLIKRRAKIDPPGTWDIKELNKIKTKRELGQKYMYLWNFGKKISTLEEFDKKSDASLMIPKIKIPTLIISAYDDSLSPVVPFTKVSNPSIITLLTKHGGHGGFFSLKPKYGDLDGHWAQNRAMEFIRLLENQ